MVVKLTHMLNIVMFGLVVASYGQGLVGATGLFIATVGITAVVARGAWTVLERKTHAAVLAAVADEVERSHRLQGICKEMAAALDQPIAYVSTCHKRACALRDVTEPLFRSAPWGVRQALELNPATMGLTYLIAQNNVVTVPEALGEALKLRVALEKEGRLWLQNKYGPPTASLDHQ